MPDAEADTGPQLSKPCCVKALADRWEEGKIIVCGGCFLPYTAIVVDDVPSWWTGLRDA